MNKHKKIKMLYKRFFCFLLALIVLATVPLHLHARALAIESAWVIYAIITYLAAAGITFTAVGGIEALQASIQEKTDTYYEVTGIDLVELLKQTIRLKTGGTGGNGGGFWFGFTAAALMADFIEWLFNNGWSNGETITIDKSYWTAAATLNQENITFVSSIISEYDSSLPVIDRQSVLELGTVIPYYPSNPNDKTYIITTNYSEDAETSFCFNEATGDNFAGFYSGSAGTSYIATSKITGATIESIYLNYSIPSSYSKENIIGIIIATNTSNANTNGAYLLFDDGKINKLFSLSYLTGLENIITIVESQADVNIPQELTEISPAEDEGVLIDTGIDISTIDSPEELAEIIKKKFVDDGTIPKPQPIIQTEQEVMPTPVPTPNPSPEYEDIESLGLPALGEALMDKFPFCLPQDLGRLLNIFTADRQTPKWEVDLYAPLHSKIPMQGDTMLSIDLSEYEEIGQITRWASVIGFCLFLLVVTKEFITW